MNLTLPPDATHVLYWHKPRARWALQFTKAGEALASQSGSEVILGPGRRAQEPAELAAWASAQLEYTVIVTETAAFGAEDLAYALRPDLPAICEGYFAKYPAASTPLDNEAFGRIIVIRAADGQDHQLVRYGTDGSDPFFRLFRRGAAEGAEITAGGTVYPDRAAIATAALLTGASVPFPDADYTAPEVLAQDGIPGGWAEEDPDPRRIDWRARREAALIPYELDDGGLPVNPCEITGIREGRGQLGRWGEFKAADAIVTAVYAGVRHLLMVLRDDGNGYAVPGGGIEPGESGEEAALRELTEETGLAVDPDLAHRQPARYVPDPRATDRAWAVTVPVIWELGDVDELPAVSGGDDAAAAVWVPARNFRHLQSALDLDHRRGRLFPAHTEMLAEYLG